MDVRYASNKVSGEGNKWSKDQEGTESDAVTYRGGKKMKNSNE